MWSWPQDKYIDQWNRIESPEINSHVWSKDFLQGWQNLFNGERTVIFLNKWWQENWICTCRKQSWSLTLCTPAEMLNSEETINRNGIHWMCNIWHNIINSRTLSKICNPKSRKYRYIIVFIVTLFYKFKYRISGKCIRAALVICYLCLLSKCILLKTFFPFYHHGL